MKSELVTKLLEESGILKTSDSKHDLQQGRPAKDHRDIENLISTLNNFSNPFQDLDAEAFLRNISAGQIINDKVDIDILSFHSKEQEVKALYMQDPKNIEKLISRNLLANCASFLASSNLKANAKKLDVANCTFNAFGKLIHMAALQKCDYERLWSIH